MSYEVLVPIIAATLLTAPCLAQAQAKFGTIDVARVLKESSKAKEAESKINEAKDAAKKEYEQRTDTYKQALDDLNKINLQLDAPTLSADAKAMKAKERDEKISGIKNLEREITEFRQTREQQLQQQLLHLREELVRDILEAMMEQVRAKHIDFVFDKSGASFNGFSPVMFSRDDIDFSADVITELNKRARSESAPTPAKASPTPAATRKP